MPRSPRPFLLVLAASAVPIAVVTVTTGPPDVAEAAASCPKPKSTVASEGGTRAWVSADRLRVCVKRGGTVRTRTFGPWTRKSRIRLDEGSVVWTTRVTRDGKPADRLWARETDGSPRWMGGLRAVPEGSPKDERLRALVTGSEAADLGIEPETPAAAWVTRSGVVVVARSASVEGPGDEPRTLVERLPEDQIAAVSGSLRFQQQRSVDSACISSLTNVVTARRTAGGPVEVLDRGTTQNGDDGPGDVSCTPSTDPLD